MYYRTNKLFCSSSLHKCTSKRSATWHTICLVAMVTQVHLPDVRWGQFLIPKTNTICRLSVWQMSKLIICFERTLHTDFTDPDTKRFNQNAFCHTDHNFFLHTITTNARGLRNCIRGLHVVQNTVFLHICDPWHIQVCVHVCGLSLSHTRMHTHTHSHTHMNTHMHTHTHWPIWSQLDSPVSCSC